MRALMDLLVPGRCAGCRRDGPALCPGCAALFGRPRRVRLGGDVPVYGLSRYDGPVREAVLAYKERGRRELATPLGRALAGGLRGCVAAAEGLWLVPVPSRAAAARRRGGDHVLRLAVAAAKELAAGGVPVAVAPGLRLARGVRDSVGLDAAARAANLAGRIGPRPGGLPPPGTAVVLLDDIATTGATVASCTGVLHGHGVSVAAALVLASAAPLLRTSDLRDRSVTARSNGRTVGSRTA